MKLLILYFILLMALPASILAQFTGGIGRGDLVIFGNGTLLNGEDGLYAGGIGRGDYALPFGPSILNADNIYVSGSTGVDGYYHSLSNSSGAFYAINSYAQTGKTIAVSIWGTSSSETGANSLNSGTWNTLIIYPKISGLRISGDIGLPMIIALNGAANVTIDGRLNASGSLKDLTFPKTKLFNSSINNFIKYCAITGDLYLTGTSSVTVDGVVAVSGNVTIESGSTVTNSPTGNLTIYGNLRILP